MVRKKKKKKGKKEGFENKIKGMVAEQWVRTFLQPKCYVRPVSDQADVGIDLYCETIHIRNESHHFWIQVKGGKQVEQKDSQLIFRGIERKKILYWIRQPVSVFLVGITDKYFKKGKFSMPKRFFFLDLHKWYQNQQSWLKRKRGKTFKLTAESSKEEWFHIDNVEIFLNSKLPEAQFRTGLFRGAVEPISKGIEKNVFPVRETIPNKDKLFRSIWNALFLLSSDIYMERLDNETFLVPVGRKKSFEEFNCLVESMRDFSSIRRDFKRRVSTNLFYGALLALQGSYNEASEIIRDSLKNLKHMKANKKITKEQWSGINGTWQVRLSRLKEVINIRSLLPKKICDFYFKSTLYTQLHFGTLAATKKLAQLRGALRRFSPENHQQREIINDLLKRIEERNQINNRLLNRN